MKKHLKLLVLVVILCLAFSVMMAGCDIFGGQSGGGDNGNGGFDPSNPGGGKPGEGEFDPNNPGGGKPGEGEFDPNNPGGGGFDPDDQGGGEIGPHEHKYYNITNLSYPTFDKAGSLSAVCEICQKEFTFELPIITDEHYTITEVKPATCTEKGLSKVKIKDESIPLFEFDIEIDQLEHEFDIKTHICKHCGQYDVTYYTDGLKFEEDENEFYKVVGYEGKSDSVIIPEVYKDKIVKTISKQAFMGSTIKEIKIPKTIENISSNAFRDMPNLTALSIPNTIIRIDEFAIYNCPAVEKLELYEVKSDATTFYKVEDNCLIVERNGEIVENELLFSLKGNIPLSVQIIKDQAFSGCLNLTSITVPDNVRLINRDAFYGLLNLKDLHFSSIESYMRIMAESFNTSLELGDKNLYFNNELVEGELVIPGTVKYVPVNAFSKYQNISSVRFEEGVEEIHLDTFLGCNIEKITLPSTMKMMDRISSYNYCLKYVEVRDIESYLNVKKEDQNISYKLIVNGEVLDHLEVPATVKTLKTSSIVNVDAEYITFAEGVESIENNAILYCEFKVVYLPKSLKKLGDFYNKNMFTFSESAEPIEGAPEGIIYDAKNSVYHFENGVLYGPEYGGYSVLGIISDASEVQILKNIKIGEEVHNVQEIDLYRKPSPNVKTIVIHDNITRISSIRNLDGIIVKGENINGEIEVINGCVINRDWYHTSLLNAVDNDGNIPYGVNNIERYNAKNVDKLFIPASVDWIDERAFEECESINSIEVEKGNKDFRVVNNCLLKGNEVVLTAGSEVVIPDCVKDLEMSVFDNKTNIVSIDIPASVKTFGKWGTHLPQNIEKIKIAGFRESVLYLNESSNIRVIEAPTMEEFLANPIKHSPNGVKIIIGGEELTEVVIPESITSIPDGAFAYATNITSVKFHEGVENIGYESFLGCTGLTNLVLPQKMTEIGMYAFKDCTALEEVYLPKFIENRIDKYKFYNCYNTKFYNAVLFNYDDIEDSAVAVGHNTKYGYTEEFQYVIINDELYLKNYIGSATEVVIPSEIDGYKVEKLANIFLESSSVTKVTVPNTVKYIMQGVFANLSSLKEVVFEAGSTINYIPEDMFRGSANLEKLTMPSWDSIERIGDFAFDGTEKLDVTIPANIVRIGEFAFENSGITNIVLGDTIKEIGDYAFGKCKAVQSFIMTEKTDVKIGKRILTESTNLKTVKMPDIASYDPYNYDRTASKFMLLFDSSGGRPSIPDSLESVEIYNKTIIYDYEFSGAKGLKNYVIGDGVVSIGRSAFAECESLSEMVIPLSVKEIKNEAFASSGITKLVFDANADIKFGIRLIERSPRLETCVLPNNIKEIPNEMFSGSGLKEITIPDTVKKITRQAFYQCKNLTTVNISEQSKIESVEEQAFYNCTSLASIDLPPCLLQIYGYAFYGCTALTEVFIPNGIEDVFQEAFGSTNLKLYREFSKEQADYENKFIASTSEERNVKRNDDYEYVVRNNEVTIGRYLSYDNTGKIVFPSEIEGKKVTRVNGSYGHHSTRSIIFPESVEYIGNNVLSDCRILTNVALPSKLKKLYGFSFTDSPELKNIVLPAGIEEIDEYAFANAFIEKISIDGENKRYVIENGFLVDKETQVVLAVAEPKEIMTIPEGVVKVISENIKNPIIKEVIYPSTIEEIDRTFRFDFNFDLQRISISKDHPFLYSETNSIVDRRSRKLLVMAGEGTIPSGVDIIADHSVIACNGKDIVIPNTVKEIEANAFRMAFGSIYVPSSVVRIKNNIIHGNIATTATILYIEKESKPKNWDERFNTSVAAVVWNAKNNKLAEDGKEYFEVGGTVYEKINDTDVVIKKAVAFDDDYDVSKRNSLGFYIVRNTVTYKDKTYNIVGARQYSLYPIETTVYLEATELTAQWEDGWCNSGIYLYRETQPTDTEHSYWHYDSFGLAPVVWPINW